MDDADPNRTMSPPRGVLVSKQHDLAPGGQGHLGGSHSEQPVPLLDR